MTPQTEPALYVIGFSLAALGWALLIFGGLHA